MMQTVKTMVVLLIVVSAILGFVIIYNLGILSFTEKQYQFATLKVLGFKNKQIKKIFIKQNLWLSIFVNKILSRKVNTIDMVSSLKGNE